MERPLEQPTKRQAYQAEDRDRAWPHRAAKRGHAVAGGILTAWLSSESVRIRGEFGESRVGNDLHRPQSRQARSRCLSP